LGRYAGAPKGHFVPVNPQIQAGISSEATRLRRRGKLIL